MRKTNKDNLCNSNSQQLVKQTDKIERVFVNQENLSSFQENHSPSLNPKTDIVQWSPMMQLVLDEPTSRLPQYLVLGGIVFCSSFLLWAWFGKIEQIGKAQGKLVPKGETYKIESIDSAKITDIAVKEGQKVKAGQLIVKLNSEQQIREVARLKKLISSYQLELNQKRHLLNQVKLETKAHQRIAGAEVRGQQSAIDSAIAESLVTRNLLKQRQSELNAHSTRKKRVQDLSLLDRQKLAQINTELTEHQQRLERLKPLVQQGAISEEVYFQAQRAYHQSQQQQTDSKLQGISNISEQIFQSEQALRQMEASITKNQGDLIAGQKKIEQLQAELIHKIAERQKKELEAQQKEEQIKLEIGQTETRIAETQNQLVGAINMLKKKSLRSPVAGTVLSFNLNNIGKVVQSGDTIAEIAPEDSELLLSAILPDREAGFVELGMTAQVKFDAYSYQDFGVIPGKIIAVSADMKTDEKLGAVYQVKIELERNYVIDEHLKKTFFRPGQTAIADIVIQRKRIMDILLEPIQKLEQDGIDL